jgi:hypothetical protein
MSSGVWRNEVFENDVATTCRLDLLLIDCEQDAFSHLEVLADVFGMAQRQFTLDCRYITGLLCDNLKK